jgi:hypothetical protein
VTLGFSALVFVVFFLVQVAVLIPNMVIAKLGGANIASPEFRNSLGSNGTVVSLVLFDDLADLEDDERVGLSELDY